MSRAVQPEGEWGFWRRKCPFTGKNSWPTKAEARESMARMRSRGDPVWRTYRCVCGAWHVSHRRH